MNLRGPALFLLGLVLFVLSAAVCWWLIGYICQEFGLPHIVQVVVLIVFVLASLYFVLNWLGWLKAGGPPL
jgi:hypothetical protein